MRIDHTYPPQGIDLQDRVAKTVRKNSPANTESVTTELSHDSVSLRSLTAAVLTAPSIRQDKVDQFKQLIANQGYKIDRQQLANELLAHLGG